MCNHSRLSWDWSFRSNCSTCRRRNKNEWVITEKKCYLFPLLKPWTSQSQYGKYKQDQQNKLNFQHNLRPGCFRASTLRNTNGTLKITCWTGTGRTKHYQRKKKDDGKKLKPTIQSPQKWKKHPSSTKEKPYHRSGKPIDTKKHKRLLPQKD